MSFRIYTIVFGKTLALIPSFPHGVENSVDKYGGFLGILRVFHKVWGFRLGIFTLRGKTRVLIKIDLKVFQAPHAVHIIDAYALLL